MLRALGSEFCVLRGLRDQMSFSLVGSDLVYYVQSLD